MASLVAPDAKVSVMDYRLVRSLSGTAGGVLGTVALTLFERAERRLLHREPVYAPRRIAGRLLHRRGANAALAGALLRVAYGAALGTVFARTRPRLPQSTAGAGVATGASIAAFELVALPATGATPRVREWGTRELALLGVQTALFGITTALVHDRVNRFGRTPSS